MDANANTKAMKTVFTVVERGQGKSYWTRIGVGFVNKDGSMNLKLDAIPVNGQIQVRDWEERSDAHGGGGGGRRDSRDANGMGNGSGNGSGDGTGTSRVPDFGPLG